MTDDSKYTRQTVTQIHTWVPDKLFSVRVTRDDAYTCLLYTSPSPRDS